MTADTLSLSGKTAIVTGSGREGGIGATIAKALARNGAAVAIHHVSEASKLSAEKVAADLAKEFGVKTTVIRGAPQDPEVSKKMVEHALKTLETDHIDILVNNGALTGRQNLLEATREDLDGQIIPNVYGLVFLTQAVVNIGKMPRGGRVINISTSVSQYNASWNAIYGASKAAQDSIIYSWADTLGRSHGITANTLALGLIDSGMSLSFIKNPDGTTSAPAQRILSLTRAEERLGTQEDVADATLLLVQEKSRWITSQYIAVSGGLMSM